MAGVHDVDFNTQAQPLVIAPVVDGKPTPQLNPDVVYPHIPANGIYTGGVASSGLPFDPECFAHFHTHVRRAAGNLQLLLRCASRHDGRRSLSFQTIRRFPHPAKRSRRGC